MRFPGGSLLHSLLFVIALLLREPGQGDRQERFEFTEIHMAMPVRIVMYSSSADRARAAAKAAFGRIASLEATMSDYRAQSELRRLQGRVGERVSVSADLHDVLGRAVQMAALTEGAFDPTAGSIVALWRSARKTGVLPTAAAIDSAVRMTGWRKIDLDTPARVVRLTDSVKLDLGGIAKGFILEEALRELRRAGIASSMIEAGGDIVVGDAPPASQGWHIEVPGASAEFAERASRLVNAALSTSGPERQHVMIGGVRYSHVVDPRTGWALQTSTTVHVIGPDPTGVDALATALTVLDRDSRRRVVGSFPGWIVEVRD